MYKIFLAISNNICRIKIISDIIYYKFHTSCIKHWKGSILKYKILTLLILSSLLFTACHGNSADNSAANSISNSESTISSSIDSTSCNSEVSNTDSQIIKDIPDDLLNILNWVQVVNPVYPVYKDEENLFQTISIFNQDTQFLNQQGLINHEYDTHKLIERSSVFDNNSFKYVKAKDYFSGDSSNYSKLTDNHIIARYIGDWNPLVGKVTYKNYTETNDYNPEWSEIIGNILYEKIQSKYKMSVNITDLPVIITHSTEYKFGNTEIIILTATNVKCENNGKYELISHDEYLQKYRTFPADEIKYAYKVTAVVVNDNVVEASLIIKLPGDDMFFASRLPTEDDLPLYYVYLNDKAGEINAFPIYSGADYLKDIAYNSQEYMFLDIDNDTIPEIINFHDTFGSEWLSGVASFRIQNGDKVNYTTSLETVAKIY